MARLLDLSPEILRIICDILTTGSPDHDHDALSLCAVSALARTCRYTSDPALDALWHTIPSVTMLAWVMPRDLWSTAVVPSHLQELEEYWIRLSFARPPQDGDFVGIGRYTFRVRKIVRDDECAHLPRVVRALVATCEVLDAFAARFPAGNLFPNLHHLEQGATVGNPGRCWISALFTPALRTFDLYFRLGGFDDEDPWAPAELDFAHTFSCLAQLSPTMHNIRINLSWPPKEGSPLSGQISNTVGDFHFLRSLTLLRTTINVRALLHLATLPSLHVLEVKIPRVYCEPDWEPFEESSTSEFRFPALRKLALQDQDHDLATCTTLVTYIQSPFLEKVYFRCWSRYGALSEIHLRDLFASLCRMRGSGALRWIHLDDEEVIANTRINQATLRPLLSLSGLTHITIKICQPTMAITDALLRDMALAWPNLNVLKLGVSGTRFWYDDLPRPQATLAGLLPFACGCPSLKILGLEFRTDVTLVPKALLDGRPARGAESKLQHLFVGLSTVEDPIAVAAFLSDAFPVLEGIWADWPRVNNDGEQEAEEDPLGVDRLAREEALKDKWQQEVREAMQTFRAVRQEERLFAVAHGKRLKPAIERKDIPLVFDFVDR